MGEALTARRGRENIGDVQIQLPLVESLGYSLDVPPDWTVIVDTRTGFLRAVLRAETEHHDSGTSVQLGAADFTLDMKDLSANVTLEEHAASQMAIYMPRGGSTSFVDCLGGESALAYCWGNGVQDITSWFVEPAPARVVEMSYAIPCTIAMGVIEDAAAADGARRILSTIEWLVERSS